MRVSRIQFAIHDPLAEFDPMRDRLLLSLPPITGGVEIFYLADTGVLADRQIRCQCGPVGQLVRHCLDPRSVEDDLIARRVLDDFLVFASG